MATKRTRQPEPERKYHHGDLRRALMDATLALISEGELGTLSLREVARRAGVTAAAPYHHFRDKSALLAAVAEEGFVALGAQLDAAFAEAPEASPRERLVALTRAYLVFTRTHRAHYRVMFLPEVKNREVFPSVHAAAYRTLQQLAAGVQAVRPKLDAPTALSRAILIWVTGHGLASLWNDGLLEDKMDIRLDGTFFDELFEHVLAIAEAPEPVPGKRRHPKLPLR